MAARGTGRRSSSRQAGSQKTRQWLTKGGLARDDSDDELGVEDHPWEWIYGTNDSRNICALAEDVHHTPSKKRKASAMTDRSIIGARMGTFTCEVGDTVLLKSPEEGQDWAGLICAFSETNDIDEEEMCVNIMWFVAPQELVKGKREKDKIADALPNEQYITADFNINPLSSINGSAKVMSPQLFLKKYPKGPPRGKAALAQYKKCIVCRKGVRQRNGRYTNDFVWEELYKGAESLLDLVDFVEQQTKGRRKKETQPTETDDMEYKDVPEPEPAEAEAVPITPQKRRKTTATTTTTPKSSRVAKYTTPTTKRIIIKKPLEFTPLGTRVLSPSAHHLASPYSHARSTLHVSSVPSSLSCRDNEFAEVYSHLSAAISDGRGACIYISGTPGTGKTATVREVVGQLSLAVQEEEMDDFSFVEINGMKVTDPHQSYSLLWEALKGDRVSPSHALELLEREFSTPSPRRIPCVVLMDELDQLVTKNQSVMYNFFNWPRLRHSRLIVLAVANTMDLPERTLTNKINSRLGFARITFPGYSHTQLMSIIQARLEGVPGNIVDPDAVQFAARKVAAVSGDARRALDICRRAVELAEQAHADQLQKHNTAVREIDGKENIDEDIIMDDPATPTKPRYTPKSRFQSNISSKIAQGIEGVTPLSSNPNPPGVSGTGSLPTPPPSLPRVTIPTIKQAINEVTSSPLHLHLRSLPLTSKVFLAAFLAIIRRTGVTESTIGDVIDQAGVTSRMVVGLNEVSEFLINGPFPNASGPNSTKTNNSKGRIYGMSNAVNDLVGAGILAVEQGRRVGERGAKCRLRVGEVEVKEACGGDDIGKSLGFNQ